MISILKDITNIQSDRKKLREFGITIGIVLLVLAGLAFWRGKVSYIYLFIVGVFFMFFGLTMPALLKPLQKVWMGFSIVAGFFMSRLVLCILFYLVITPIGLLNRVFGKDILDERMSEERSSYWCAIQPAAGPRESCENQY